MADSRTRYLAVAALLLFSRLQDRQIARLPPPEKPKDGGAAAVDRL